MSDDSVNVQLGAKPHQVLVEIDPAILAELTRALLPYLGPYSITTVKRASRTTSDALAMVRMVAEQIDDLGKREHFTRSAKRLLSDFRHEKQPLATPLNTQHVFSDGRTPTPITPELMHRGEAALAPIIGPLANVLVQRYAKASENSRDFFERLAGHLRSPEERATFFANVRKVGNSFGAQVLPGA